MTKQKDIAENAIRDIRRATRRQYSAEEKIRIVLEGLRGEGSIAELCRNEGINQILYYRWSKEFPEAGKKRLAASDGSDTLKLALDSSGLEQATVIIGHGCCRTMGPRTSRQNSKTGSKIPASVIHVAARITR